MSEPVRVAVVAEGPTEKVVLSAAISSMLAGRSFILKQLQPEESVAFGPVGTGWVGVYRWCRQAVARSGSLGRDVLFQAYDVLVLQLDADVAGKTYGSGSIQETVQDLPCERPCPPPSASTNPLRRALLRWAGETQTPARTVLCTPSKSTDTWVLAALFPNDQAVGEGLECRANVEGRFAQQPVAQRIRKRVEDYRERAEQMEAAWPRLAEGLSEAERFDADFRGAVHQR
ncbi:MAG: hypothetical protein C5B50_28850 [Verrucomicrobia bacterium]|nr:MAG: hypothetical protein C5B50_28850 [Verrucomicrobiota bacterium]